jgi:N-methylhydantoinase A/oxoprolinase/acetone carboxylase beta subunit
VPHQRRKAYFDGWVDVDVYAAERLQPGNVIQGPAIIEAETTTVAQAVLFLASDDLKAIHGSVIIVDEGQLSAAR